MRLCAVADCGNKHEARGLCNKHYGRLRRWGRPCRLGDFDRFMELVDEVDGHWIFTGPINDSGYGLFWVEGRHVRAHRYSYEHHVGPISDGLVVDHVCHNRACVRPERLREATVAQNISNRSGAAGSNASTGVRNVYPNGGKFMVRMRARGQVLYFGSYETIAEAESVAVEKRREVFGEFAGAA